MESSLARDDTPLFWDALVQRGPRTPWSPERTIVHPPGCNPEMLAGASSRVGATTGRPTWGASHSTTDEEVHPYGAVGDSSACIVTSKTADGADQSTTVGAHDGDGAHRSRGRTRCSLVDAHPSGVQGAFCSDGAAGLRESDGAMGAHPGAPRREPSPADGGRGRIRRHRRRLSYSSTDDTSPEVRHRSASVRATLMVRVRSSRSGHSSRTAHPITDGMMRTS